MAKKIKPSVLIFAGKRSTGEAQPHTFRLCPLGMQFYAQRPMTEFELLELKIPVPSPNGRQQYVRCNGVVVHCRHDSVYPNMYRIWVHFLDLPESTKSRLKCVAKKIESLCPYCENF